MRLLLLLVIFVGQSGIVYGKEPIQSSVDRLAKVEHFAFGGVGFAGVMSEGEKDYRVIRQHPLAIAQFARLYREGNLQAKLYAVVGMRQLAPGRYDEFVRELRLSKQTVVTMHGCIVSEEPLSEELKQIEKGNYDKPTLVSTSE